MNTNAYKRCMHFGTQHPGHPYWAPIASAQQKVAVMLNVSGVLTQTSKWARFVLQTLQAPTYFYTGVYRVSTTPELLLNNRDGWYFIDHERKGTTIAFMIHFCSLFYRCYSQVRGVDQKFLLWTCWVKDAVDDGMVKKRMIHCTDRQ